MDAPAAGLAGTGQQGMSETAPSASRGAAPSQDPERAVNSTGSGEHRIFAAALLRNRTGLRLRSCRGLSLHIISVDDIKA